MKLLKDNEETFAKSFPGFKADEEAIIGACIDGFHKNPAHQRKLLDDPNNFTVANRHSSAAFNL